MTFGKLELYPSKEDKMKFLAVLFSIFFFSAITQSVFASDFQLKGYLKLHDALTKEDFERAVQVHEDICKKDLGKHKNAYKDCGKNFNNIEELRQSFKQLSSLYIANTGKKDMKDLIVVYCSMAKAKWIQSKGEIKNPYESGKEMLACGIEI